MKVFYDISVLGVGQCNPLARTGVARVVENIAYGLTASKECDLFFCESLSFQILKACIHYRDSNPQFKGIPFAHSSFTKIFYNKVLELSAMLNTHNKISDLTTDDLDKKYLIQSLIHSLENIDKIIQNYPYSIDPKRLAEVDIFHANFYPISERARQAKKTHKFLTVFDLIPILYPQFFGNHGDQKFPSIDSLEPDDWVICISNSTKNDLCNYLPIINPDRVFVTHLGAAKNIFYPCFDAATITSVRNKHSIPDSPYLLTLSTLEPRKNIAHVIRCFARTVQEQNITELFLVLVGNKGWNYGDILNEISNQELLKNRIILTGSVADEDLAALYSGALAFIYPSFYEGFGLPPLEAMQCGTPVITSNTSSLPEVVGDAGIMLDPTDTDSLCHSILEIYNKSSLRSDMSLKSLEQAKKFSWENCTQETIAAYRTALSC